MTDVSVMRQLLLKVPVTLGMTDVSVMRQLLLKRSVALGMTDVSVMRQLLLKVPVTLGMTTEDSIIRQFGHKVVPLDGCRRVLRGYT